MRTLSLLNFRKLNTSLSLLLSSFQFFHPVQPEPRTGRPRASSTIRTPRSPLAMDTAYVKQFKRALAQADDASALSMLDNRRITAASISPIVIDGFPCSGGVLFLAVERAREKVVSALLALGADIDAVSNGGAGDVHTPLGVANMKKVIVACSMHIPMVRAQRPFCIRSLTTAMPT